MQKFWKNNKGFTLAEVLITLGIVGVIAAMTLPTLIEHHKKVTTATRVKKFYSEMNNVLRMAAKKGFSAQNFYNLTTGNSQKIILGKLHTLFIN